MRAKREARIQELSEERDAAVAEFYTLGRGSHNQERRATLTRRIQLIDARIEQESVALEKMDEKA